MRGDEARNGRKRTEEYELGNGGMRTGERRDKNLAPANFSL